ncbi:hypothetical protein SAMN06269185_2526 [Natronoarchaeum philippinense]|uniref:Uncharacterized protein n=1 Tax=Natronoarchaeum philippinense TaxID=558529 RepID=A0A285P359_NATPI|nr:hypothetical protein [Natronoarchaeum philippinense]SNZ15593.1 hypothetical protein SAMN06269185_2526 [Natronoarchaeum philippinense]
MTAVSKNSILGIQLTLLGVFVAVLDIALGFLLSATLVFVGTIFVGYGLAND